MPGGTGRDGLHDPSLCLCRSVCEESLSLLETFTQHSPQVRGPPCRPAGPTSLPSSMSGTQGLLLLLHVDVSTGAQVNTLLVVPAMPLVDTWTGCIHLHFPGPDSERVLTSWVTSPVKSARVLISLKTLKLFYLLSASGQLLAQAPSPRQFLMASWI